MTSRPLETPTPRTDGLLSGVDSFGNIPTMEDRFQRMCRHARTLERELSALQAPASLPDEPNAVVNLILGCDKIHDKPRGEYKHADVIETIEYLNALRLAATQLAAQVEAMLKRWEFCVANGFPRYSRQTHPEVKELGWRMRSQEPPQGQDFCEEDYPYYETADAAVDAAIKERT
jgi:hypothetical protein